MRLLTEILAAATTTSGAENTGGFDPWKMLGIPGAIAAVLTLVTTYGVGVIRPLAVKTPRYWHAGGTTQFSCIVRNRSWFAERTITGLTLVRAPGWLKRTFWPRWKRKPQAAELLIWGGAATPDKKVGKRDEVTLTGELRKGKSPGVYEPSDRARLLAHAGSKSSRSKPLAKT
jgi:hypothetical protein